VRKRLLAPAHHIGVVVRTQVQDGLGPTTAEDGASNRRETRGEPGGRVPGINGDLDDRKSPDGQEDRQYQAGMAEDSTEQAADSPHVNDPVSEIGHRLEGRIAVDQWGRVKHLCYLSEVCGIHGPVRTGLPGRCPYRAHGPPRRENLI
jgi:hypothetical protein